MAVVTGGPTPACACEAAAAVAGEPAAAAAAITRKPLELSAAPDAAGVFAGSAVPGIAVATGLTVVRSVAFCCAAVLASVVEPLSADVLSLDVLSVDLSSVDLPSPAFEPADLVPLRLGASVLPSELAGPVSPGGPLPAEGSSERLGGVESAADVVSREVLSVAEGRCEGGVSGVWVGALEESGWMLLSTSAAKLGVACDGSRPTGFAGALE